MTSESLHADAGAYSLVAFWADPSPAEVCRAVANDCTAAARALVPLCRLDAADAVALVDAIQRGDVDSAAAIDKLKHKAAALPDAAPCNVLQQLSRAVRAGARLDAQVTVGGVQAKLWNIPAEVPAAGVEAELRGEFGPLLAGQLVPAAAPPARFGGIVMVERGSSNWGLHVVAADSAPRPCVSDPSYVSVISVDKDVARNVGVWMAETAAHLIRLRCVEVLGGALQRFTVMWLGDSIKLRALFHASRDSDDGCRVWTAACEQAMQDWPGVHFSGGHVTASKSHFVVVSWSRQLQEDALITTTRLFRHWGRHIWVAATRVVDSTTGGGGALSAPAPVGVTDDDMARAGFEHVVAEFLRGDLLADACIVDDPDAGPPPADVAALSAVQRRKRHMDSEGRGNLDLRLCLLDGVADRIKAVWGNTTYPELSPFELARLWIMRVRAQRDELPDNVRVGPNDRVFSVARGGDEPGTVHVLKVPRGSPTSVDEAVAQLVHARGGDMKLEEDTQLWYHDTAWEPAFTVAQQGIEVDQMSEDPRLALELGWGFYLASEHSFASFWARRHAHDKHALLVFAECRERRGDPVPAGGIVHGGGIAFNGTDVNWRHVVALGARKQYNGVRSYFKQHCSAHVAGPPMWVEGPILRNRRTIKSSADAKACDVAQLGTQLCIRTAAHAEHWDTHLVGVVVFGADGDPQPTAEA